MLYKIELTKLFRDGERYVGSGGSNVSDGGLFGASANRAAGRWLLSEVLVSFVNDDTKIKPVKSVGKPKSDRLHGLKRPWV